MDDADRRLACLQLAHAIDPAADLTGVLDAAGRLAAFLGAARSPQSDLQFDAASFRFGVWPGFAVRE